MFPRDQTKKLEYRLPSGQRLEMICRCRLIFYDWDMAYFNDAELAELGINERARLWQTRLGVITATKNDERSFVFDLVKVLCSMKISNIFEYLKQKMVAFKEHGSYSAARNDEIRNWILQFGDFLFLLHPDASLVAATDMYTATTDIHNELKLLDACEWKERNAEHPGYLNERMRQRFTKYDNMLLDEKIQKDTLEKLMSHRFFSHSRVVLLCADGTVKYHYVQVPKLSDLDDRKMKRKR